MKGEETAETVIVPTSVSCNTLRRKPFCDDNLGMDRGGIEPDSVTDCNATDYGISGGGTAARTAALPRDLLRLAELWPALSEDVKADILRLAENAAESVSALSASAEPPSPSDSSGVVQTGPPDSDRDETARKAPKARKAP